MIIMFKDAIDTIERLWSTDPVMNHQPDVRQARNTLNARRRALRDELKNIEQAIEAIDRAIASGAAPLTRAPRVGTVKEAVANVVRTSPRPIHANDIVLALQAQGIELSPKDPKGTVVTALIRLRNARQVEAMGRNTYRWIGESAE